MRNDVGVDAGVGVGDGWSGFIDVDVDVIDEGAVAVVTVVATVIANAVIANAVIDVVIHTLQACVSM